MMQYFGWHVQDWTDEVFQEPVTARRFQYPDDDKPYWEVVSRFGRKYYNLFQFSVLFSETAVKPLPAEDSFEGWLRPVWKKDYVQRRRF